uniref:PAS domain-containing protein n=1 Tax=Actinotalea sp. C106 TaxID=2908644 RepID=UPI0020290C02
MDYENLFDRAPCGYLLLDDGGVVVRANSTFLDWTGWTAQALVGTPLARVLPVGDRVLHATVWSAQLHLHGAVERFRCHVLGPDGSRLAVLLTATRHEGTGLAGGPGAA